MNDPTTRSVSGQPGLGRGGRLLGMDKDNAFQLVGLEPSDFAALFALSDAELQQRNARRVRATREHGFPCRISLEDASVGDELILLPYVHQPAASPYRASGPIFVRRSVAPRKRLAVGEVSEYVTRRVISLRGYDAEHMLHAADVAEGAAIKPRIAQMLADPKIAYIHVHNAKHGCYFCSVERVCARSKI